MQIIQSKLLNKFQNIKHFFTTKKNGNLAFHVGDNLSLVLQNHINLAELSGYDLHTLVHMKQIHSNIVHRVTDKDNFENPPTCDALITDKRDTPLMVMVADCTPILFYDDAKKVIAVAHAGRAGAFSNIVQSVCSAFEKEFHSNLADVYVATGASIGACCYEVGSEIFHEAKELHLEYALREKNRSYYLDIASILHHQLLNAGIKEENIDLSQECTSCQNDKYFSYRVEDRSGRFAGVISLI